MKKILLSVIVMGAFGAYAVYQQTHIANTIPAVVTQISQTSSPTPQPTTATPGSTTAVATTPTPAATVASSGQYKDGTYTGPVTNAFYGNIQVAVTISGGKITDVNFLQYPHDRGTSVQINSQAMPQLKSEAIAAQSANVDVVSGATQSSQAFQQSLAAALAQAKS